jgi:hypothetical protein
MAIFMLLSSVWWTGSCAVGLGCSLAYLDIANLGIANHDEPDYDELEDNDRIGQR